MFTGSVLGDLSIPADSHQFGYGVAFKAKRDAQVAEQENAKQHTSTGI